MEHATATPTRQNTGASSASAPSPLAPSPAPLPAEDQYISKAELSRRVQLSTAVIDAALRDGLWHYKIRDRRLFTVRKFRDWMEQRARIQGGITRRPRAAA